jgi:hypothetical protein
MSFLNNLFAFKEKLAIAEKDRFALEVDFPGYSPFFKVVHPSIDGAPGGLAFVEGANAETRILVGLIWREAMG